MGGDGDSDGDGARVGESFGVVRHVSVTINSAFSSLKLKKPRSMIYYIESPNGDS